MQQRRQIINNRNILIFTIIMIVGWGLMRASINKEQVAKRKSGYPVMELILQRWSSRAMSGELLTNSELMTIFEAARWAPSSYNNQPWRFIYAIKNSPEWNSIFNLLVPFNKLWAKNAAALVVIISANKFTHNNEPSPTHSFDTGAAWANMALQGTSMGLVMHAIEGFDYQKAREELKIPDGFTIEAMLAIGKPARKEVLPLELQEKEVRSGRRPITELIAEGSFEDKLAQ